jgi:hypothetical protein
MSALRLSKRIQTGSGPFGAHFDAADDKATGTTSPPRAGLLDMLLEKNQYTIFCK